MVAMAPLSFHNFPLRVGVEHLSQGNIPAEQGKHLVTTIEKMLCGGIYDQARGYSSLQRRSVLAVPL